MPSCARCDARLDVVVADGFELAGFRRAEEPPGFVEEALLVGVPRAGDDAEAAEAVPVGRRPVLADLAILFLRLPLVVEGAAEGRDLVRRVADVRREDAPAHDLVVGEAGRQRPGAVVVAEPVAAVERTFQDGFAGGGREELEAVADVEHRPARELQRDDLDQAAGELRRLVRRVRLRHLHAVHQRGGEQVERHDLLVRLGGRDDGAAQRGVAVAFAEAADEHVLVADHRQAGDALHRLGRVRIPVRPHLLRAHVVGDDLGVLALGQLRFSRGRGGVQRLTSNGHIFAVAGHGQRHVDRGARVSRRPRPRPGARGIPPSSP